MHFNPQLGYLQFEQDEQNLKRSKTESVAVAKRDDDHLDNNKEDPEFDGYANFTEEHDYDQDYYNMDDL